MTITLAAAVLVYWGLVVVAIKERVIPPMGLLFVFACGAPATALAILLLVRSAA